MARTAWDHILDRKPSLLEDAQRYLREHPNRTATEIARALKVKLSSLSSILRQAVAKKLLSRHPGGGPRGGYTYDNL
jgi:Mn-dependent DtxR family transcriptional regulator